MENTAIVKERIQRTTGKLDGNTLKLIAIAAMLIDHIAWGFVPTLSLLGQIMHIIGRITAPTMCYFIAEGYYHTRSVKKYALRLFVFAVIAYLPFVLFETKKLPTAETAFTFNVIYTLLLGLLALWAWDKMQNKALKILIMIGLCILAIPGDWAFFGVTYVLAFGINHGDFQKQIKWFCIVSAVMVGLSSLPFIIMNVAMLIPAYAQVIQQSMQLSGAKAVPPIYSQFFQLGVFLVVPLLMLYNGARGGGKYSKWIFYVFYPTHLLILALLKMYLIK